MINTYSLKEFEIQFPSVGNLIAHAQTNNVPYEYSAGRLAFIFPHVSLCIESVENMLMWSRIPVHLWRALCAKLDAKEVVCESLVCYANVNGIGYTAFDDVASIYFRECYVMQKIKECENGGGVNLNIADSMVLSQKKMPTLVREDILYALVGIADSLEKGECGVSDDMYMYGVFVSLDALREAYLEVLTHLMNSPDATVQNAKREFRIHAFAPNKVSLDGVHLGGSYYIE